MIRNTKSMQRSKSKVEIMQWEQAHCFLLSLSRLSHTTAHVDMNMHTFERTHFCKMETNFSRWCHSLIYRNTQEYTAAIRN